MMKKHMAQYPEIVKLASPAPPKEGRRRRLSLSFDKAFSFTLFEITIP